VKAAAVVDFTSEANDRGFDQDCVYATCSESGVMVGPIWGHSDASVKRALAELTETCTCGAGFHSESGEDDF
jgi:hypothetical protein